MPRRSRRADRAMRWTTGVRSGGRRPPGSTRRRAAGPAEPGGNAIEGQALAEAVEVNRRASDEERHAVSGDLEGPGADPREGVRDRGRRGSALPPRGPPPRLDQRTDGGIKRALELAGQAAGRSEDAREIGALDLRPRPRAPIQPTDVAVGIVPAHHPLAAGGDLERAPHVARVLFPPTGHAHREQRAHPGSDIRQEAGGAQPRSPVARSTAIAFFTARPVASTDSVAPAMFWMSRYGRSGAVPVLPAYCLRKRRSLMSPP